MLFHHEFDDLFPSLPGKPLLGNEALGVTGDAERISLCRAVPCNKNSGT